MRTARLLPAIVLLWAARALAQPADEVTLVFAGDIMLDELPGEAVARERIRLPPLLAPRWRDLAIGSLECAVAEVATRWKSRSPFAPTSGSRRGGPPLRRNLAG